MKIAIIGAGAMGMLYAALLGKTHEVTLVDRNAEKVSRIERQGVVLYEQDGSVSVARPHARVMGQALEPVELAVVFVKSMATREALERCRALLGEHTLLMTLQNGGGHEETLSEFAPMERILIGTTQHNASVREDGSVFHGGSGKTVVGSPLGESADARRVAEEFARAGVASEYSDNIRATVWQKLMTNASLSALTGVFQMPMGFITDSASAWALCQALVREACDVARADGICFDVEKRIAAVRAVSVGGAQGITSICADLMQKRKTEVDTISGSVVRAAKRLSVPAPRHEMMVLLIHAMEDKNQ